MRLTLQLDDFLVGDDVHLIKDRVVLGHVLVLVLLLLLGEEGTIDCMGKKEKPVYKCAISFGMDDMFPSRVTSPAVRLLSNYTIPPRQKPSHSY